VLAWVIARGGGRRRDAGAIRENHSITLRENGSLATWRGVLHFHVTERTTSGNCIKERREWCSIHLGQLGPYLRMRPTTNGSEKSTDLLAGRELMLTVTLLPCKHYCILKCSNVYKAINITFNISAVLVNPSGCLPGCARIEIGSALTYLSRPHRVVTHFVYVQEPRNPRVTGDV